MAAEVAERRKDSHVAGAFHLRSRDLPKLVMTNDISNRSCVLARPRAVRPAMVRAR